jgi:hypothetical protein
VPSSSNKLEHEGNNKVVRDNIDLLSQKEEKDDGEVFSILSPHAVHVK